MTKLNPIKIYNQNAFSFPICLGQHETESIVWRRKGRDYFKCDTFAGEIIVIELSGGFTFMGIGIVDSYL